MLNAESQYNIPMVPDKAIIAFGFLMMQLVKPAVARLKNWSHQKFPERIVIAVTDSCSHPLTSNEGDYHGMTKGAQRRKHKIRKI